MFFKNDIIKISNTKGDFEMKRFFATILLVFVLFSFGACENKNTSSKPDENTLSTNENSIQKEKIVSVPELVGKNIQEIEKYKNELEFVITYEKNRDYDNNIIFHQSIAPGVVMEKNSKIEISVSKRSSKMIVMPNVIGKTEQEAIDILLDAGFMYEYIARMQSGNIDIKGVNKQYPTAGEKVFADSEIDLYITPF